MKKKILILLLFGILFIDNIDAECTDKTIVSWAEDVSIKMEEVLDGKYPYSYLLMLDNPRNDLRVVAKDTYSANYYNVEYDKEFNNYVIGSEIHFITKEYNLKIYMASNAKVCAGELVKTITYNVPKYNEYRDTLYCEENSEDEDCKMYANVEKTEEMDNKIKKYYIKKVEKEEIKNVLFYEKLWYYIKEYSPYVLVPLISLSLIYAVIIFIVKKRSERE